MVDAVAPEKATGAENVVWDLSPLYAGLDDPAIQTDMQAIEESAKRFQNEYRGRVASLDAEELRDAVEKLTDLYDRGARLGGFAQLSFAADTSNPQVGALMAKMMQFGADMQQYTVFFTLEWNQVPDEQATNMLQNLILAPHAHYLEAERRNKPFQLSEEAENLIAQKDVVGVDAWDRFFDQLTSSLRFDFDGKTVNQSQILAKSYDPDREARRKAAAAITETLRSRAMELTYIFNTILANKQIEDKLRGFESWISSRNLANKAPDAVVNALIETVTSNYEIVARHYRLKRVLLGVDELTEYDRYAPIPIKSSEKFYTWDEAKEIVLNAFYAFSDTIGDAAKRFFDENWIHAALNDNKRGGAFAHPITKSAHPYVFVNYTGQANDVMTLAHELGHGVHMLLSGQSNENLFALFTPLTTAETASIFAEMLVFSDLLEREEDPEVRLSMIVEKVESSFATIFRQVSMNRFEDGIHTAYRTDGELSTERISDIWMKTQRAMFSDSVNLTDDYGIWWSYIPHFIGTPGYVYAYAFGELLVFALYDIYKQEGQPFAPKYVQVLAAGNNDYPDKIMANVGIDLNDPAFWEHGIHALRELVEQEEALAREIYPEKF